jgi:hypothetical protein
MHRSGGFRVAWFLITMLHLLLVQIILQTRTLDTHSSLGRSKQVLWMLCKTDAQIAYLLCARRALRALSYLPSALILEYSFQGRG